MSDLAGSAVVWAVLLVQILGIVSVCLARFSEGCACQKFYQGLFFVCLALVAGSAIVSFGLEPGCWLTSAGVLAVMVVAATLQLGHSDQAVAW
jgi:hypothetical protein